MWFPDQKADRLVCLVGEEPDSPTASWNLPPLSKHASTANVQSAESLSDDRARTISEGWKQYVALPPCPIDKPWSVFSCCQDLIDEVLLCLQAKRSYKLLCDDQVLFMPGFGRVSGTAGVITNGRLMPLAPFNSGLLLVS